MQIIRLTGLIAFLGGFLFFVSTLFTANYTFTEEIAKEHIATPDLEKLEPAVQDMYGKEYGSKFAFISDFNARFNSVNQTYKDQQDWDNVIWTNYTLPVTKASAKSVVKRHPIYCFIMTFVLCIFGGYLYVLPGIKLDGPAGIKNNGIFHSVMMARGWLGIAFGVFLILFYIALYWYPEYIAEWIMLVDPVSLALSGNPAGQWFLYGLMYTVVMLVMGTRMFVKYRHSKYQLVRTVSVLFFQTAIAFLLPEILVRLNQPYYDFKNMWPLDYDFFFEWHLDTLIQSGGLGVFMLVWGIVLFTIGVPVFVFFFGKRWYCSWVCGCGGLAETLGDPYRQLSDKSLISWKIERYLIHGVLVFAVVMTMLVLLSYFTGQQTLLGFLDTGVVRSSYGFFIGSIFSGVVGTGFYPLMGNRVWCRFGCPLAAYLGIVQKFKSRFRITTNGGQCISCGNCSTYCEMGIDVKSYAQRGENIIRSSCVGCGVCSAVCPRGVLNLENRDEDGRFNGPSFYKKYDKDYSVEERE